MFKEASKHPREHILETREGLIKQKMISQIVKNQN